MNMESLNKADIEFILSEEKQDKLFKTESQKGLNTKIQCGFVGFKSNTTLTMEKKNHSQIYRSWTLNLQKWGRSKPRWNWFYGFPFLIINKAEEVIFSTCSVVLAEDTIFTTKTFHKVQKFRIISCWFNLWQQHEEHHQKIKVLYVLSGKPWT